MFKILFKKLFNRKYLNTPQEINGKKYFPCIYCGKLVGMGWSKERDHYCCADCAKPEPETFVETW